MYISCANYLLHYRAFGEIKTLRLPKKLTPGSDQHRGFAFVDYHSKADAKVCAKMQSDIKASASNRFFMKQLNRTLIYLANPTNIINEKVWMLLNHAVTGKPISI